MHVWTLCLTVSLFLSCLQTITLLNVRAVYYHEGQSLLICLGFNGDQTDKVGVGGSFSQNVSSWRHRGGFTESDCSFYSKIPPGFLCN